MRGGGGRARAAARPATATGRLVRLARPGCRAVFILFRRPSTRLTLLAVAPIFTHGVNFLVAMAPNFANGDNFFIRILFFSVASRLSFANFFILRCLNGAEVARLTTEARTIRARRQGNLMAGAGTQAAVDTAAHVTLAHLSCVGYL